jgi:hypothetical protein
VKKKPERRYRTHCVGNAPLPAASYILTPISFDRGRHFPGRGGPFAPDYVGRRFHTAAMARKPVAGMSEWRNVMCRIPIESLFSLKHWQSHNTNRQEECP